MVNPNSLRKVRKRFVKGDDFAVLQAIKRSMHAGAQLFERCLIIRCVLFVKTGAIGVGCGQTPGDIARLREWRR